MSRCTAALFIDLYRRLDDNLSFSFFSFLFFDRIQQTLTELHKGEINFEVEQERLLSGIVIKSNLLTFYCSMRLFSKFHLQVIFSNKQDFSVIFEIGFFFFLGGNLSRVELRAVEITH